MLRVSLHIVNPALAWRNLNGNMPRSLLVLFLSSSLLLTAQTKFEYWPGTAYDSSVPTQKQVLGYEPGEKISPPADIVRYLEALAAAKPDRIKLREYGRTWEGRRLVYVVIGSSANVKRLDEIKDGLGRLADPRKASEPDAAKLVSTLPALVWLAYGVHGNEISSPDAGLMMAYHLVAARNDKVVDGLLSKLVVAIDPLQNPDGRNRFVNSFESALGLEPDPYPLAAEHTEPWPAGRTNHYFFDMNRDWVAMTQPETRGRIKALREWHPQVVVDLHEMGTDSTYYFAPPSDPYNPNMTKWQKDYQYDIGKGNAKWFDQFGFSYFIRDTYDAFYPGYGDSWPVYTGAIAMTYENGSTRGLVVRRPSTDMTITFRETVRRHFVSSIATCETTAMHHDDVLKNFHEYGRTAVEEGKSEAIKEYILPRRGNVSAVDKLAEMLTAQDVEVRRATAPFSSEGKQYPEGSYAISLAQPAKRRIRVLLDANTVMDDKFLQGEEARRKRRLSSEIYDVTAWSVPLQFGVEAVPANAVSEGRFVAFKEGDSVAAPVPAKAAVAYLAPWGSAAAGRFLAAALREDLRVFGADKPFTQNGKTYSAGTLVIPVLENPASIHDTVARLAKASGAELVATSTTWVDDGPSFGSRKTPLLRKPSIAIAWDQPVNASSAGETRFVLERQFGYPVSAIRMQNLGSADLRRFNVIILPDVGGGGRGGGGYAESLGPGGIQRLKEWVSDGGTLIGISGAVQFLADPRSGFLAVQREDRVPETPAAAGPGRGGAGGGNSGAAGAATPPATVPGKLIATAADLEKMIQPDSEAPESLHGALVKCIVDPEQWISAGVPESVFAMVSGRNIFTPIKIDKGVNAVTFAGPDDLAKTTSGYMWDEYRKQLAFKPFVIVSRSGGGNVIGFTANPNYRAAMDGLNVLLLNAVFRGPAHSTGQ